MLALMLMRTAGVPPAHDHETGGTPVVRKNMSATGESVKKPLVSWEKF